MTLHYECYKKIFYFIAALAIVATSCSDNNDLVVPLDDSIESDATALYSNKVSLNLVETLAKSQSIKSRAGGMATKLSCYTRDKDTLFYVIDNPKGGWDIVFDRQTCIPDYCHKR